MKIRRGKQQHLQGEREGAGVGGEGEGGLSRRPVLGGLVALPVLYGIGSAAPALATRAGSAQAGTVASGGVAKGTDGLVRGVERRYNAPLLTAGTRLVLPVGIKAVPVADYYHRPHLGSSESAWPRMTATDGTTVDASIVPERGAATRIAMLSGFSEGWYELIHASGRPLLDYLPYLGPPPTS